MRLKIELLIFALVVLLILIGCGYIWQNNLVLPIF